MKKRRSLKDAIKETNPKTEHHFIHLPGGEFSNITAKSYRDRVDVDLEKEKEILNKAKGHYSYLHNHPSGIPMPSEVDLYLFIKGRKQKFEHIVQRNTETGEIEGMISLKRAKRTKQNFNETELKKDMKEYARRLNDPITYYSGIHYAKSPFDELNMLAEKYGLKIRCTPEKGYQFNRKETRFQKKSLEEKAVVVIMGLSFISAILSLSGITGNVIGATETKSLIGIISIIIGLTTGGIYLYLKKKH